MGAARVGCEVAFWLIADADEFSTSENLDAALERMSRRGCEVEASARETLSCLLRDGRGDLKARRLPRLSLIESGRVAAVVSEETAGARRRPKRGAVANGKYAQVRRPAQLSAMARTSGLR